MALETVKGSYSAITTLETGINACHIVCFY